MQNRAFHQRELSNPIIFRALKLFAIALVFLISFSIQSNAQVITCQGITPSPVDSASVLRVEGKPGDTVWVPVKVFTQDPLSGFQILLRWDQTKVRPIVDTDIVSVPIVDTTYFVKTQLVGRFVQQNSNLNPNDTTTNFYSILSEISYDSGAIFCGYNLTFQPDTIYVTPPGNGVIFRMAFEIFPVVNHNDSALIRFYNVQPTIPGDPPVILDCRRTEFSIDFQGTGATVTRYPRIRNGYIVADSAPAPVINLFEPAEPVINAGDGTILNYNVANVDSIHISGGSVNFGQPTPSGSVIGTRNVNPQVTTTYTLQAINGSGITTANTMVTVVTDTTGDPDAPTISFPEGNTHTVEQGQTVTFRVRATDDPGNTITLSATSLPNNATFPQVVGSNDVEGVFSFTPDVTQEGAYVASFMAQDNNGNTSTGNATIIVVALQFDRLFSTSAIGQSPVGGLRGKRDIVFPINMVSQQTVFGVQFDMEFSPGVMRIDSFVVTPRTPDYVIYDNIGDVPGQIRVVTFGLNNEEISVDSSSTKILDMYLSLDTDAVVWTDYLIDIFDGRESIDPDPNIPSLEMVTDPGIVQVDNPGDVNLDKRIDVADLVSLVAYIIGNFGLTPRQFDVADIIVNDTINVFDLVADINAIFGIPISPTPPPPIINEPAVLTLDYTDLQPGQQDVLVVKSDLPERVAAAELNITYDKSALGLGIPQLGADAQKGMALQYKHDGKGNVKILMYFKNPFNTSDLLPSGPNVEMVKFPIIAARPVESGNTNQLKLSQALLSAPNAASIAVEGFDTEPLLPETFELYQNYPNPFNPETNIKFTVGQAKSGAAAQIVRLDIYNILGQRVKNLVNEELPSGNYHVVWDARNEAGQRVSTGVYFYRMVVGSESQSKKMLLLK